MDSGYDLYMYEKCNLSEKYAYKEFAKRLKKCAVSIENGRFVSIKDIDKVLNDLCGVEE